MPVAAVIATQLTDASVPRTKGLYVGGVDVIKDASQRYGVPIETISVTEAGPGNVSSMSFTIDDPGKLITVSDGMEILFQDFTYDFPIFRGFVQSYNLRTDFGGQGRSIDVQAVGVEILLDWAITTVDLTFTSGTVAQDAAPQIQRIFANTTGAGQLRVIGGPYPTNSTQATPTGWTAGLNGFNVPTFTIPAGTTLREAIRQAWTPQLGVFLYGTDDFARAIVTVDFYYGLRVWSSPSAPSDYSGFYQISETGAAQPENTAEQMNYLVDASSVVRGVFVQGTGVSALVMDGTGKPGSVVPLQDTTVTTAAGAQAAASAYLNQYLTGVRGSFVQADRPNMPLKPTQHPGSTVIIALPTVDLPGGVTFKVLQVDKTFNSSGRENWTVYFGGPPPSAAAAIRRLTRSTLS